MAVAGSKGFGGGFEGTHVTPFSELEMKSFVEHTRLTAERLDAGMADLGDADLAILCCTTPRSGRP